MGWLGGLVGLPLAFRGVGKWDAALGAAAEAATLSEKVADRSTASWLGTHMGSRPSGMQWILGRVYITVFIRPLICMTGEIIACNR